MELRHIRYFVRAAEFLHFTRAAESLCISQPALSLHIQQLEKEVGSPLFDRVGRHVRHVRLTEAGKRLLVYAHEMLRVLEAGKQEIADLQGLLCGSVTLGTNNIFVSKLMSKCLAEFSRAHPGVEVIVKMLNQDELEKSILTGSIDLALAWLPPESNEIQTDMLFSDELVLVVSTKHPLAHLKRAPLHKLHGLQFALPTPATNIRRLVDAELARKNVSLKVSLEIDDTPARLTFVEAGIAATLAPRKSFNIKSNLRAIPVTEVRLPLSAGLLTQRGVQLSSAARSLANIIRAHFED